MTSLTNAQYQALEEAYSSLEAMCGATVHNANGTDTCSSFHIKNPQLHVPTVRAIHHDVLLYLNTWVRPKLAIAMDLDTKKKRRALIDEQIALSNRLINVRSELNALTNPS